MQAGARLQRDPTPASPTWPFAVTIILAGGPRQPARHPGSASSRSWRSALPSSPLGLLLFSRVSVGGGFLTDILGPSVLGGNRARIRVSRPRPSRQVLRGGRTGEQGLASGLINTSNQIGAALGLAVLSTIATPSRHGTPWLGDRLGAPPTRSTEGFQRAFLGGAVIAGPRRGRHPGS